MCLLVKTKDHENIMILLLKVLYYNVHFLKRRNVSFIYITFMWPFISTTLYYLQVGFLYIFKRLKYTTSAHSVQLSILILHKGK